MSSLAARANGCLLSSSLTNSSFPTGLCSARQPPACAIAMVSPLQGQKMASVLLAFHEVPANTCSPPPSAPVLSREAWETFLGKIQAKKALSLSAPLLSTVLEFHFPFSCSPIFPLFTLVSNTEIQALFFALDLSYSHKLRVSFAFPIVTPALQRQCT